MEEPRIHVFHHECYVTRVGCVSSDVGRRQLALLSTVMPEGEMCMRYVLPEYTSLFAKAAASLQKRIYFHSPPAEFWGTTHQDRHGNMLAQLVALAKQSRFLASDSKRPVLRGPQ